jgi:hypothetical protein
MESPGVTEAFPQVHAEVVDDTAAAGETPTKTHLEIKPDEPETVVLPDPVPIVLRQGDIVTEEFSGDTMGSAATETDLPVPQSAQTYQAPKTMATAAGAAPRQPAAKKPSKTGMIIGVLVALLLIAGIGGAGGWYAYTHYYKAAVATPTPSPSPMVSPTPVQQIAVDTNSNTNANTEVTDTNTSDTNANRTVAASTPGPGSVKTTPGTPGKTGPVRTTQPPSAKPSAKPKSGNDRTVILQ